MEKLEGNNVVLKGGGRLLSDMGGHILEKGKKLHCYLASGRVAAFDLRPGDVVTLALETTYRPTDPPFMSSQDLVLLHNQEPRMDKRGQMGFTGSQKFARVGDGTAQVSSAKDAEIERLKKENQELRDTRVAIATATPGITAKDLDGKTVQQLREMAAEEEVDLSTLSKNAGRQEIVAAIINGLSLAKV